MTDAPTAPREFKDKEENFPKPTLMIEVWLSDEMLVLVPFDSNNLLCIFNFGNS